MAYIEPKIEITINAEIYEQLINNVRYKAPLEISVELVVYMLMYGVVNSEKYCVLGVDTMSKKNFLVYCNKNGKNKAKTNANNSVNVVKADKTTDLVIVGNDFKYNGAEECSENEKGAYAFIEIKNTSEDLSEEELNVQAGFVNHYICTNGLKWVYKKCNGDREDFILKVGKKYREDQPYKINKNEFDRLLRFLSEIKWDE